MKVDLYSSPRVLSLSLSNVCSAKCIWCPLGRGEYKHRDNRFLPTDIVDKLIKDMKDLPIGEVWFSENGEGLLNPNFEEIVTKCRVSFPKAVFATSTNLHLLTEEKARFILSNDFMWFGCNLDGMSQEAYGAVKGLNVENAKKNLSRFIKLRRELEKKCELHLDVLTQPDYYRQIGEPEKITVRDETLDVFRWAKNNLDWGRMDWVMRPFALTWAEREKWNKPRMVDEGWCIGLPIVGRKFFVDTDGGVYGCCLDFNTDYCFGNVLEETVMEIWNGARRREFVDNLFRRRYENIGKPCELCHD